LYDRYRKRQKRGPIRATAAIAVVAVAIVAKWLYESYHVNDDYVTFRLA
tara:strand:+ start:76 stop:222 length:147 start_codon:yes stop_codon:yes gene_type:complete